MKLSVGLLELWLEIGHVGDDYHREWIFIRSIDQSLIEGL